MNPDKDREGKNSVYDSGLEPWEENFFETLFKRVQKIADEADFEPSTASQIESGELSPGEYLNIPENAPECYNVDTTSNGNFRIGSKVGNLLPMNVCVIDRFEVTYKKSSTGAEFSETYFIFEDEDERRLAIMKSDALIESNRDDKGKNDG